MFLLVDYREKWFFDDIEKHPKSIPTECIKSVALPVGDFVVSETEDFTSAIYIIERKSISDLAASIVDGRFREQKSRLAESLNSESVVYLIEGSNS